MSVYPIKISAYLRKVGNVSQNYFSFNDSSNASIDACNFTHIHQGNPNIIFDFSNTGYFGSGYMKIGNVYNEIDIDYPVLYYPIKTENPGIYNVYLRVRSSSSNLKVIVSIDEEDVSENDCFSISTSSWDWIKCTVNIPDTKEHDIGIKIESENILVDSIFIGKDTYNSDVEYDSYFCTIHAKIYELDYDNNPVDYYSIYDTKNTIDTITQDDWYFFDTKPLPGNSSLDISGKYTFTLFLSGKTDYHYVLWDYAENEIDPYSDRCSFYYNQSSNSWVLDCDRTFSIRIYSYKDSFDSENCSISTPEAELLTNIIDIFDNQDNNPKFLNTKVVDNGDNSNRVELLLSDKIINFVIDQSGSQTWNDNEGVRHDISLRMLNKINSVYPGDLKYNIYTIGSSPINTNFYGVVEDNNINTNDIDDVFKSFFSNQENLFSGIRLVRSLSDYPSGPLDGEVVSDGFLSKVIDNNLVENERYFYTAFSYDSNNRFSQGKNISIVPMSRDLPYGISYFSYNLLRGSGVRKDSDCVALWHFDEGYGNVSYDFTTSQSHLYYSGDNVFWLNKSDVHFGNSAVRLDGSNYFYTTDENSKIWNEKMTIMGWVFPFSDSSFQGIFSYGDIYKNGLYIGIDSSSIFVTPDFSEFIVYDALTTNEWNHIAVTVDNSLSSPLIEIYVNGVMIGSDYLSSPIERNSDKIQIGNASFYNSPSYKFFGKIKDFAIFKDIKNQSYIYNAYNVYEFSDLDDSDNGDRLILLNFSIPDTFNFPNGKVRILMKEDVGSLYEDNIISYDGLSTEKVLRYGEKPWHENDGSTVYEGEANSGSFVVSVSEDFVLGRKYYFKIMSQNISGVWSHYNDSPVLEITVPQMKYASYYIGNLLYTLPAVENYFINSGNKKNYIYWDSLNDENVKQIKIWASNSSYPIVENGSSDSDLVFIGNKEDYYFVHRNIDNNVKYYYTIICYDRYGFSGEAIFIEGTPSADSDDSSFPLQEIRNLKYELIDEESVRILWDLPLVKYNNIEAWFDQRIVFYCQIIDDDGDYFEDLDRVQFKTSNIQVDFSGMSEDVFGDTIQRDISKPNPEDLYLLSYDYIGNGVVKGTLKLVSDNATLSAIKKMSFDVSVYVSVKDKNNNNINSFEYYSRPISVSFKNPWEVNIVNKNEDYVEHLCKKEVPLDDIEFLSSLDFDPDLYSVFDGCYIRRSDPFVAQVQVSYKGQPLSTGNSCLVSIHDASDPQCENDFSPLFSDEESINVLPESSEVDFYNITIDSNSGSKTFSAADISIKSPRYPQGAMLFIKTSYNGYTARRKMYIVFENILRIDVTSNAPEPNCIDRSEQFASCYIIDPDNPSSKTYISDMQICRWELRKSISGKDRPFYSIDNVPNGPGVFSYFRKGTAGKVYFGPACGVTPQIINSEKYGIIFLPEIYAVKASVVYDGLKSFEEIPLVVWPKNMSNAFGSRFLMEGESVVTEVWADGYDYSEITISHDANTSSSQFSSCFRECASNNNSIIYPLSPGQNVNISAGEMEIIYGEDIEKSYDEDISEYVFENYSQSVSRAEIPLSYNNDNTKIYLKLNKFIGDKDSTTTSDDSDSVKGSNACECLNINQNQQELPDDIIVTGDTIILVDQQERYLRGGGSLRGGIPPVIIRLVEPLYIQFVDQRINGVPTDKVVVDGITEHEFIIEVSFSGKPVPIGTPVSLSISGSTYENIEISPDNIVYAYHDNDEYINPSGDLKSFVKFTISPLPPTINFSIYITATCNYDKIGDVERSMSSCININYNTEQISDNDDGENSSQKKISSVFSNRLDRYDVDLNTWENLLSMSHPRGCLTFDYIADSYGEYIFAIGGIDGNNILSINERYDVLNNVWENVSSCDIPRCCHVSCVYGRYIYIFGGFSVLDGELYINRSVERYDTINDEWEKVSDMPSIGSVNPSYYGTAFSSISVIGNKAYILCGIREINSSSSIKYMNDRVLIYNLDDDSWSYSDKIEDIDLYQRISPISFVDKDSNIRVLNGAITVVDNSGLQNIEFLTNSFILNQSSLEISNDEFKYDPMPKPAYKSGYTKIDDNVYVLGGSGLLSKSLRSLNIINTDVIDPSPFTSSYGEDINKGVCSCGISNDNYKYVYVAGGITSGRPDGFLQIKTNASPSYMRLDGKESISIEILLNDEYGNHPDEVKVFVRGYIVFPFQDISSSGSGSSSSQTNSKNNINRNDLVYPVVFSSNEFYVKDGSGVVSLLPRSEDILQNIKDIKEKLGIQSYIDGESSQEDSLIINQGDTRFPYNIMVQVSIIDDFYYGETVVSIEDNNTTDSNSSSGDGGSSSNNGGSSGSSGDSGFASDCISIQTSKQSNSNDNNSNSGNNSNIEGLFDGSSVFSVVPSELKQFPSSLISCYSDIDWIPQSKRILYTNDSTYNDALKWLKKIKSRIPFGGSPLYDAMMKVSEDLVQENAQDLSKIIYLHTDNEENLSTYSQEEVIDNIQSIDGFYKVPVIINNYSITYPVTLSALSSRTDTDTLEKMAYSTGGQSQTVISSSFINDNLNNSISKMAGSIGYGTFEYTIDLEEKCVINSISIDYILYENTSGNWKVSVSDDGFNYSDYSKYFSANTEVSFEDLQGRYLKFNASLLSGLSASIESEYEGIPLPGSPAITSININYSYPKTSFIFLNQESMPFSAQQIISSVNAHRPEYSDIEIGVSTGESFNWNDYYSSSQPTVDQCGKIFIPIRTESDNSSLNEPLEIINDFSFRAKYGRWNSSSNVIIKNQDGDIVDNTKYKVYPRSGVVVFANKQTDKLFIDIENQGNMRLGIKITNKSYDDNVTISGIGYMYNTNVFLSPPVSEKAPYVNSIKISPDNPYIYSAISLEYKYNDLNRDPEDDSIIKWYVNGIELEYLRNLKSWNDINNTSDVIWIYGFDFSPSDVPSGMSYEEYARQQGKSILNVGDTLYCTVKPFDGKQYGQEVRSNYLVVVEAPPFVTSLSIKAENSNGEYHDNITTGDKVFAEYNFFADDDSNKSIIIWYVNGFEFKRGYLGETSGSYNNNEIVPGEANNSVFALQIGNVLQVEIIPSTSILSGSSVKSEEKTVENQPPIVSDVIISPDKPKTNSNLSVTYVFNDIDISSGSSSQSNQSSVRWYRKKSDEKDFSEVLELRNQSIVRSQFLTINDQWKAEVVPFDGLSVGDSVFSDSVTIY